MNQKITYIIAIMLLAMHFQTIAAPVDTNAAKRAALTFMQTRKGFQQLQAKDLQLAYTSVENREGKNEALYYVFNVGEHAFVTVAASDRSTPILAYSTTSRFETDRIPDNAKAIWREYQDRIIGLNRETAEASSENRLLWERLTSGENIFITRSTQKAVEPLIKTTWSQSPYYNKFCPYDSDYQTNAITGCVATAMAQVIKYWEYPSKGFGHCAYTHPKYGFLTVNYEETTYHYDSMPVILDYNSSEAEVNAVARLMSDCGVGTAMSYSPTGSSAQVLSDGINPYNAEYVLTRYFGYVHNSGYYKYKNLSSWEKDFKNDLDKGLPILMAGFYLYGDGHAFICDGYDEFGLYHFNWGWNGNQDGYYLMDSANGFCSYQNAIFGLMPPQKLNTHHLVLGSMLQTNKDTVGCSDPFHLNVKVLNNGSKPFSGTFRLSLLNSQTKEIILSFDSISCKQNPITTNNTLSLQFPIQLNNLVSTNYLLVLYYQDTISDLNNNDWKPVGEIGDYNNEKVIRFEGGKTTASVDSVTEITATSALVNAHVEESCSEKIILKQIQYKKSSATNFTSLKDTSSEKEIHLEIKNLEPNTSYDAQCYLMVESNGTYNTYTSTKVRFTTAADGIMEPATGTITLHPNPAREEINLLLPDGEKYRFEVFNSLGQKVMDGEINGERHTLHIGSLKKGLYFITLQNNTKFYSAKFAIEK